jgi:tRNA pseudouridine38-40 synthase
VASHEGAPASARSLNALLPRDVAVLASGPAPDGFDARSHATARSYCYRIWTRRERPALLRDRVLWHSYAIDVELLKECAQQLAGEHDFEGFTISKEPYKSYRRTIRSAEWIERDRLLEFWITSNSFTRRMVRSLVSFQLDVAGGRRSFDDFKQLLDGAPRGDGGGVAAAAGLYLASVEFPPEYGRTPDPE